MSGFSTMLRLVNDKVYYTEMSSKYNETDMSKLCNIINDAANSHGTTYTLMNMDTHLATVTICNVSGFMFDVLVLSNQSTLSDERIRQIIKDRKPYMKRANIDALLKSMGVFDITGYFDVSLGLSLNDTLWLKPEGSTLTWNNVSLYDNDFNEVVSRFAFSGSGLNGLQLKTTSPELGTNGVLPKCWKRVDNEVYLYKGGTSGCSNTGNEPYSEYFASQLLNAFKPYAYVEYDLLKYHGQLVSTCGLFTCEKVGYTPVCALYSPTYFEDIIAIFDNLGLRCEFNDLMVFDALICNTDRHLNNYGFMTDNKTFSIVGMAPVFDNGMGLFPFYTLDKDFTSYVSEHDYQNCGISNKDVLNMCLEPRHKKQLRSMLDFTFEQHPIYKIPGERLAILDSYIKSRIMWMLSL